MQDDSLAQLQSDLRQENERAVDARDEAARLQQRKQRMLKEMTAAESKNRELVLALEKEVEVENAIVGTLSARNAQYCSQMQAATRALQDQMDAERKARERSKGPGPHIKDAEIELTYKAQLLARQYRTDGYRDGSHLRSRTAFVGQVAPVEPLAKPSQVTRLPTKTEALFSAGTGTTNGS